jgi:hypothetical protein
VVKEPGIVRLAWLIISSEYIFADGPIAITISGCVALVRKIS